MPYSSRSSLHRPLLGMPVTAKRCTRTPVSSERAPATASPIPPAHHEGGEGRGRRRKEGREEGREGREERGGWIQEGEGKRRELSHLWRWIISRMHQSDILISQAARAFSQLASRLATRGNTDESKMAADLYGHLWPHTSYGSRSRHPNTLILCSTLCVDYICNVCVCVGMCSIM